MFCCFLILPRGRAFGEFKIHVLHISLLIIAMILSLFQERREAGAFGGIPVHCFFSIDSSSCSDHSHSQRDGNSRLLFLQLVIPNLRTFGEIRITTRVSKNCQRGGSLLLLMISLLKGTGAFWESPGSCVFDYSSCSNCSNFLTTPTGTGALGKLKVHAWEMLSTHRSYYNE